MDITLGQLTTRVLQDPDDKEIGFFELDVTINQRFLETSGDVQALAKRTIATWLCSAVMDTKVPPEYWVFETNPKLARKYNFPLILNFGGK